MGILQILYINQSSDVKIEGRYSAVLYRADSGGLGAFPGVTDMQMRLAACWVHDRV